MAHWKERFSLTNRTALITGASSGIGFAIAEVFADAGAKIIAHGRTVQKLDKLRERLALCSDSFTSISADFSTPAGVQELVMKAFQSHQQIDILVNSAGVALTGAAVEFDLDQWQTSLAINLTAPFLLSRALLPGMINRKMGKIISISSQTGVIALENHSAYAASKGGLNALTKVLMTEAAPHNVQVNAICPTVILTEMGRKLWSLPERKEPFLARTPLGRFGEPEEIADMALYLASPASDLVNGALMMIEGGYSSI